MSKLVIDLTDNASIKAGLAIIAFVGQGGTQAGQQAEAVNVPEHTEPTEVPQEAEPVVVEEAVEDDAFADLMAEEPEATGPTVDDIKQAFKALATAKGKEGALTIIHNIFKRLGVKKMEEIEGDKIPVVIQVLEKAAAAK